MRIAIVGSGIAGLCAAYRLCRDHEITVFESCHVVGGNVRTFPVEVNGSRYDLDVGASFFNVKTYPAFFQLLDELGVPTQAADLSCVVDDHDSRFVWRGTFQQVVFGNPLLLLSPSLRWLTIDALKFYWASRRLLKKSNGYDLSLEEFLGDRCSRRFLTHVLFPLVMVIWGAEPDQVGKLSARCVAEYLLRMRPGWRIVRGGTREYLSALTNHFQDKIRLSTPVRAIRRNINGVEICTDSDAEQFDSVVIATHADQALQLLSDPTDAEQEVLGSFTFQTIGEVLHRDPSVLSGIATHSFPSICIRLKDSPDSSGFAAPEKLDAVFHLNRIMASECPEPLFGSLAPANGIAEEKILAHLNYRQPIFTPEAVRAQRQWDRINGRCRTYYCGAYWGFGEHEDAVNSAFAVVRDINAKLAEHVATTNSESAATIGVC